MSGVEVLIASDEVLNEDVYAVAGRVIVEGTVNGDLVAAGETVRVDGTINGDLIVAARSITIDGAVEDDVRAAGAELRLFAPIGGDLIVAGDQVEVASGSTIGQDLVAAANGLIFGGEIDGDLDLSATEARIEGTVRGNVEATVEENLTLGSASRIEGALNYTSPSDADMQSGAEVLGEVTRQAPMIEVFGNEFPASALIQFVSTIISQTKWFIGTLLVGLILIWLFPETLSNAVATLSTSPWKSLGIGMLLFVLLPILFLITMIVTLSIIGFAGFSMVAIPASVYAVLLLLAKPAVAIALGGYLANRVFKREELTPIRALLAGAAILAVCGLFPYVDSVVGWLSLLCGFGMWLLFFYRHYRDARTAQGI